MIVRGTTPYHTFVLPMASSQIEQIYVTYLQNNQVILDKGLSDITFTDNEPDTDEINVEPSEIETDSEPVEEQEQEITSTVTIHLSQEDTLKFQFYPAAEKNIAVIQIRILDTNGEAYASDPITERIFGILKEGVITNENA
jgi:hypothetical protein